jgi:hypothetical protein
MLENSKTIQSIDFFLSRRREPRLWMVFEFSSIMPGWLCHLFPVLPNGLWELYGIQGWRAITNFSCTGQFHPRRVDPDMVHPSHGGRWHNYARMALSLVSGLAKWPVGVVWDPGSRVPVPGGTPPQGAPSKMTSLSHRGQVFYFSPESAEGRGVHHESSIMPGWLCHLFPVLPNGLWELYGIQDLESLCPAYRLLPFTPQGAPSKMTSLSHRGQVFYFSPESAEGVTFQSLEGRLYCHYCTPE